MIIKIDDKTRIGLSVDCFALMRPTKKGWEEIKWFSSLEHCLQWVVQRDLAEGKDVVSLKEFLTAYRREVAIVRDIHSKNIT